MEAPEVQGSFMPFRFAGFALAAMLMLSACGGGGSKNTTASGPQRLDVTARDYTLNVSGSTALRPGPVQITAHNAGKQAHGFVLAKLKDGLTAANVIKTFVKDPGAGGAMLLYAGGTTTLPSGSTWKGTTSFDPGTYLMVDVGFGGGRLNFTRQGEIRSFTVSGNANVAATAKPVTTVSLWDYTVEMPNRIAGKGPMLIRNTGNDTHQLSFIRVKNPSSGRSLIKRIRSGKVARLKGFSYDVLAPSAPDTATTVDVSLPKGTYVAYCRYYTPMSHGIPHMQLGMAKTVQVTR
jgi:hypothetical protein